MAVVKSKQIHEHLYWGDINNLESALGESKKPLQSKSYVKPTIAKRFFIITVYY